LSKISEGKIPFLITMTKTGDLSCLLRKFFEKIFSLAAWPGLYTEQASGKQNKIGTIVPKRAS
jgi:hypothetical protein